MKDSFDSAKGKIELGFTDNKLIPIKSIKSIDIQSFRSLKDRRIELGSYITVLAGRNGTMKTTVMGLISHPFGGESKDAFGRPLKTSLNNVFKFSTNHDTGPYKYELFMDVGKDVFLKESVTIRLAKDGSERHRIVVSGHEKGDGNFVYNTSFLNLKRLLPMVDTNAIPDSKVSKLTDSEKRCQIDFYEKILPSMEYSEFTAIHEANNKTTFAPAGKNAKYDYESISSGEDNLGSIFNRMIGFQRAFDNTLKNGNGVFCIDEFESGLHPVAQLRLFQYLVDWSKKYKVQIILTTHSLHLIQHIHLVYERLINNNCICLNFFSKANVGKDNNYIIIKNPSYNVLYKELTFEEPKDILKENKINVLCEDDMAIDFIKKLIKAPAIKGMVNFISNLSNDVENPGTSFTTLINVCKSFSVLLSESFVVFDADVKQKGDLSKIKNNNLYMILPDADSLALERRIIIFILNLDGNDAFFRSIGLEKEQFLDQFKIAGVASLNPLDVMNEKVVNISNCKSWAKQNSVLFKKCVTRYVSTLDNREFISTFINRINFINKNRGLPLISI